MTRRGQFKTSGFYSMKPDYENKMIEDPDAKKKRKVKSKSKAHSNDENNDEIDTKGKPKNDYDLETYSRGWIAGSDHYDKKNTIYSKYQNKYLLYGRPQLGKTGVYLQIGYLIWKKLNKPMHTSPRFQDVPVVPLEISSGDEEDISVSAPAKNKPINPNHFGKYPLTSHISGSTLTKPGASKRYGDPNNPDVLKHYKSGAQYPHESVYTKKNEITMRNNKTIRNVEIEVASSETLDNEKEPNLFKIRNYSQFCSLPLQYDPKKIHSEPFCYHLSDLGDLYISESEHERKFVRDSENDCIYLRHLRFPPILIPSSGRPRSALLNLNLTMKENDEYVQIVILKKTEAKEYGRLLLQYCNICFFIMDERFPETVGAARYVCQVLAEKITHREHSSNRFAFILDDNISHWVSK